MPMKKLLLSMLIIVAVGLFNYANAQFNVTLNVDMHGSGLNGETVYFAGNFGGIYGSWDEPGNNANDVLTDDDGDSVYTVILTGIAAGDYMFKFFMGPTWSTGEWTGDPNRRCSIAADKTLDFVWADKPFAITLNVDMHGSGLNGETVYIAGDFKGDYGSWNEPGTNASNILTDADADSIYTIIAYIGAGDHQFKFFKGEGWDGGEWTGDPNRTFTTIEADSTLGFVWGVKPEGINENPLAGKVSAYPVPCNNVLYVNATVDVKQVVLANAYGQQISKLNNVAAGTISINTSNLADGMYFITFVGKNGGQLVQKLIKN